MTLVRDDGGEDGVADQAPDLTASDPLVEETFVVGSAHIAKPANSIRGHGVMRWGPRGG